jgi:uncharacterized protein
MDLPVPNFRTIRGDHGLWVIDATGRKRARLPLSAVDDSGSLRPPVVANLAENGFLDRTAQEAYAVTALTSTACNLGCAYCYQNTEQSPSSPSRPPRIANSNLDQADIREITRFVRKQMLANDFAAVTLLLFGGEPLLNPDACVALLDAFGELNLVYADMITNGTLLTGHLAARLAVVGLRAMQITYDGGRESHDKIRVTRAGLGTFDLINKRVKSAVSAADFSWTVRINVSPRSAETLIPLAESIASTYPPGRSAAYFSPVFDYGIGYEGSLQYSDDLVMALTTAGRILMRSGIKLKYQPVARSCPYCGVKAGKTGAVINADGTLYSCWATAGHEGLDVGHVSSGFVADDVLSPRWQSCESGIQEKVASISVKEFQDRVDFALLEAEAELRKSANEA